MALPRRKPTANFFTVWQGIECAWLIDGDDIDLISPALSDDDFEKASDAAWEDYCCSGFEFDDSGEEYADA